MFTGIIEECGTIDSIREVETGAELWISCSFANEVELGESIAVNGACLTATEISGDKVRFDLLHETIRLTNLADRGAGRTVNLERSLRLGDRLSGHFVQGHVDTCSKVLGYEQVGQDHRLEISLPGEFAHLVVHKGSICIDGISLTVAELLSESLVIWIIPHTHEITALHSTKAGERVNLEFDLLAKHIARLQSVGNPPA